MFPYARMDVNIDVRYRGSSLRQVRPRCSILSNQIVCKFSHCKSLLRDPPQTAVGARADNRKLLLKIPVHGVPGFTIHEGWSACQQTEREVEMEP